MVKLRTDSSEIMKKIQAGTLKHGYAQIVQDKLLMKSYSSGYMNQIMIENSVRTFPCGCCTNGCICKHHESKIHKVLANICEIHKNILSKNILQTEKDNRKENDSQKLLPGV